MAVSKTEASETQVNMESVYRRYYLPLKKYVYGMCLDAVLADDIVSETFYRAIKNIDSYYGGNIFTWLCTIAKNLYFNHRKKMETQNVSLDAEDATEPAAPSQVEDVILRKEENLALYEHLKTLDPIEQDVIHLRIFAECSFAEIGSRLGKSENWARVTFFRIKEKLRRRMSNA